MSIITAKNIIAEWLERDLPALSEREVGVIGLDKISEILAIFGPRRAGKTFYMFQLIKGLIKDGYKKEEILFIDFEDYRLIGLKEKDIGDFFTAYYQLVAKYPKFVFFDEIQHLKNWSRVLRTLHNQNRYKIIISGSSSKLLSQEISTELRGRYRDIKILPFSFKEYLKYKLITYKATDLYTPKQGMLLKHFDDYLVEGGFPENVKKETLAEKRELLRSYYQTIFYKDIIERYNIKAKYLLEILMQYCLNIYGRLFSISAFEKYLKANDLQGSKKTIANYYYYLKEAFFIINTEKFSTSLRKRIMNPKKTYLLDVGFIGLAKEFSENKGLLLENIVAIKLNRKDKEIFYYKENIECDFLIKEKNEIRTAIQVCWQLNEQNTKREMQGLVKAAEKFKIKNLFLLTYDQDDIIEYKGYKIEIMPVWKWLLLF